MKFVGAFLWVYVTAALLWAVPGVHADYRVVGAEQAKVATLGSTDAAAGYNLEVDLSGWGASVMRVRMTEYHDAPRSAEPYVIQTARIRGADGSISFIYPYAARSVSINGQMVDLSGVKWELIEPTEFRTSFEREQASDTEPGSAGSSPSEGEDVVEETPESSNVPTLTEARQVYERAVYRITIEDEDGGEVLELRRVYELGSGSYDLRCHVELANRSDADVEVVWDQLAQGDLPLGGASYLGDRRLLVGGYRDLDYNPSGQFIYTDKAYLNRSEVVEGEPFWPNGDLPEKRELIWAASLNRYFTVVTHPVWDASSAGAAEAAMSGGANRPGLEAIFKTLLVEVVGSAGTGKEDGRRIFLRLFSHPIKIGAGGTGTVKHAVYAGPRRKEVFESQPYASMSFGKLIKYELGCTFCTFQPLARGLLSFLKFIHGLLGDWGIAIVVLVLCVRLLLHPITKKAQINMMKMGKQMQAMQPELEKLKKKYKDDTQRFQQEQMKLWREKGVNPVNMLGCLPMFLQTPIWVALYAMLYFAVELRHEPAFYGVFQKLSGGTWGFLGDLSSPDSFVKFAGDGFTLPLYFINPTFGGINVLPILMGVVFLIQQKLTSPPPANEQAAQQQRIMQIMMVVMFPVMLYSAPSGLTLYILASTFAGIVDSYIVRRHIKREEEAGTLFDKKPPKPGGFFDKFQKVVAEKQEELLAQQQRSGGKKPGGGANRKGVRRKGK